VIHILNCFAKLRRHLLSWFALCRYLRDNLKNHNTWAARLFLVQFLYLLNVFGNILLIDVFLRK
jgi:hypothetical protein